MENKTTNLAEFDSELAKAVLNEQRRQEEFLELIASENYASPLVMQLQGSVLTNKYAEGYPAKRYYGGCEWVDVAEDLAVARLKKLFGVNYANVQPHSGSQANAAVYLALLEPGDTILAMDLSAGGHLTHGSPVNFSGKIYHAEHYGVDEKSGLIDYDKVAQLAQQHKPKVIVAGMSAYSREIDWGQFRKIADEVGAYFMVDMAHISGLVAAGVYPSPIPHADVITSTTHKTLRGPRGGFILVPNNDKLEKKIRSAVFPGTQGGPFMHIIAAKAIAFKEALQPQFKVYQQKVIANARAMADRIMQRGYKIVSGGTDNHMLLVDLTGLDITGKDAESALDRAHMTVNKNTVPGEQRSPFVTSGLRIGTPAITTRGMMEQEAVQVADWLCDILDNHNSEKTIENVKQKVKNLCDQFPVYSTVNMVSSV